MKILTPYRKECDIDALFEAGADELYFGFYDDRWIEKFGDFSYINRMSDFKLKANAVPFEEAPGLIDEIKRHGLKAFVTMNAAEYSVAQVDMLEQYLSAMEASRPDGIIVSSLVLAQLVQKHGIKPVASTMCGIFNSDILKEYIDAGVSRVILPRELTLSEIEDMCASHPEIEFEVFLMRNGCRFADSHCLGVHGRQYGALCNAVTNGPFKVETLDLEFDKRQAYDWNFRMYNMAHRGEACSLCAIYRLMKAGVDAGKIVGRNDNPEAIKRDILLVKKNIEIARSSQTEEEYLDKMIFPPSRCNLCLQGLSCYYPEVRFPCKDSCS